MRNEVDQSLMSMRPGSAATKEARGARMVSCIGIVICTAFSAIPAQAESLGGMKVLSALNEPLRVQIDLNGNNRIQPGCAKAQINSPGGESFGAADVRIVNEGDKQAMMLVTRDAMNEPAVNVVVQLSCDSQEERSYPVLLDLAQPESAALAMALPDTSNPLETSSENEGKRGVRIASSGQVNGGVKLRLVGSLSGANLLAARMGTAVDSAVNDNEDDTRVQEEQNLVPTNVDAIGAHGRMHQYWQLGLGTFAALMGLMIWSFWRSARRVSSYPTRKAVKHPASKQVKTRQAKTRMASAALDPIPYTKPDMSLFASTTIAPSRATIIRENRPARPAPVAASLVSADDGPFEDMGARLPLYNVEEVVDEAQLAKLWVESNQPLRAIELFESYWGQKQPSSPVPWQCLLELYRTTGDLNKYRQLIGRYSSAFGESAVKRSGRNEYIEEGLRKQA